MVEARIQPGQLPASAPAVPADRRVVSAAESRIVLAAIAHLGAVVGAGEAGPLAEVVARILAPTANKLAAELRAAGYDLGRQGRA